ncbi:DUF998 domain-containing protein [Spirosoma aureum]|uniref:DUF998 domain-containing protein n=1 Tax=Spirosoma aureum TaxID=2692134 RepID=A0A6G9AMQ4_9BACT|nr:DUF998 domain-containing protein [Spirosoma aureum]QIP13737.1 DUF998 domain-containing protein [Spirosoma aureum]
MTVTRLVSTDFFEKNWLKKALLFCGIIASVLYISTDILAAVQWEDYSYADKSVSELRAIGAPTRPFLIPWLTLYALLEIAFGIGIWGASGRKLSLHITGGLLIGLGLVD